MCGYLVRCTFTKMKREEGIISQAALTNQLASSDKG